MFAFSIVFLNISVFQLCFHIAFTFNFSLIIDINAFKMILKPFFLISN